MKKLFLTAVCFIVVMNGIAQWRFHAPSVFGGDTVYQPQFQIVSHDLIYCMAGRSANAEGQPRLNTLYKSSDFGNSWRRIASGNTNSGGFGFVAFGKDTIIAHLEADQIRRSFDGGLTWEIIPSPSGMLNGFLNRTIHLQNNKDGILESKDLGLSFTKISSKRGSFITSLIGYSVEYTQNKVYMTNDGGITWIEKKTPDSGLTPLNGVFSFPSEKVIYAKVLDKMYRSDDAGDSWKVLQTFSRSVNINTEGIYFINAKDGFHAFGGEFFKTNDSGRTWCLQPPSLIGNDVISQNTFVMHFENDSLGIWANGGGATGMTTMTTTNQGGPPCPSDTTIKGLGAELGFNQLKVFPNPSAGLLTLALEQGQLSQVQLFSMEGRLVFSQKLPEQEVTLQLPAISPGIYMLEVQSTANKVFRQKLVIE